MRPNYAGPVLALTPQHRFNISDQPNFSSPFSKDANTSPQAFLNQSPSASTPASAGRKRSRDEAALEEDYFPAIQPVQPIENEEEWEYGPGMTLIKPNRHIVDACSQAGEEKPEQAVEPLPTTERPILRAAKSQRLTFSTSPATPVIAEEVMNNNGALEAPSASSPTSGPTEPTVDDFTRYLGIGWSLVSTNVNLQDAIAGWTKYINNSYPITDAKITLQSRGLQSFLVQANEGYFLFQEDLKRGQLVSTDMTTTLANLRGPVPIFESDLVMEAGETPKVMESAMTSADSTTINGMESTPMNGMEPTTINGAPNSNDMISAITNGTGSITNSTGTLMTGMEDAEVIFSEGSSATSNMMDVDDMDMSG